MPKGLNLKAFGRRKSAGNILDPDEQQPGDSAPISSFRVIERPDKKAVAYGAVPDRRVSRPFNAPLHALRGKSDPELSKGNTARQRGPGWPLTGATRGSGGTTNSGSSGYYDSSSASARHSSTSTLPSSLDPDRQPEEEEELFAPRPRTSGMNQNVTASADTPAAVPPPPSFLSNAARALSFGNRKNGSRPSTSVEVPEVPPMPPAHQATGGASRPATGGASPHRERAMTTSSYASTAVPNKPELNFSNDFDLGDDWSSSMFDTLQKREPQPSPSIASSSHRTESEPLYPPRALSRNENSSSSSSPHPLLLSREQSNSPYSYDEPDSAGLSSNSTLGSPNPSFPTEGIAQAFLGNSKTGYARVPERYASPPVPLLERRSTESSGFMTDSGKSRQYEYPSRQTEIDDDERWVKRVELHDPQESTPRYSSRQMLASGQSSAGATRRAASPVSSTDDSWASANSITTTPRAAAGRLPPQEESLFDASPSGPASRAIRNYQSGSNAPKKMTKAQFQALQKRNDSSAEVSEEEENASSEEYDDDDDVDRAKKIASQRRQQEATMSVYRQQMKKVTGGGPTDLPSAGGSVRPPNERASSSGFYFGGIGGTPPAETIRGKQTGDEDEDVPLGILQAHGFPSANRPPTVGENDLHQRRTSMAGSTIGGNGGNLPAFARRLPADPYYGAGIVNQTNRESLAMHGTAQSVYGMPTGEPISPMGHPGGLVGVIAGEEKARAARRGSHMNGHLGSNPVSTPMPHMPRAMSMGNMPHPSVYTPTGVPPMPMMPQMGMGQMPMTPGMDPQMQHFMQMQMQLMQNMIDMQQAQLGQPGQVMPQQGNDVSGMNRPVSVASQHSFQGMPQNQGRAMTMMHPPPGWNASPAQERPAMPHAATYAPSMNGLQVNGGGPGAGYTPSIAPSERSNIGMPTRYRPVTQYGEPSGRIPSMTSSHTLHAFQAQQTPAGPGTPFNGTQAQTPKSTIRVIEKSKSSPRIISSRPADEDEEEAWADMKKKREEKKKSRFTFHRSKKEAPAEPALSELYQNMD